MKSATVNGVEYTSNEANQDALEDRIEALAEDWHKQLLDKGYVSEGAPFRNQHVTESDFLEWAESDGIYYPAGREDMMPILMYHAREYLLGDWD